ncbi:hypothetical protein JIR001_07050 [Polycladomyces abyssicola]|jgi:uncharacterized membrane protein|uniref:Uncharacterized protein n=1 Tax=Polycladomyces abyssicola TaxID=1125966 RepID=A0A8D5UCW8_9BACL|nr:hypothetical protein [Polycladomyces abyssicola]BCU80922.1 hypothetical protein JIR001_07050 [Polycladomyces abyssicola]
MVQRKWLAVLYYAGLLGLTLFMPLAIMTAMRERGEPTLLTWIGGGIAFVIWLSYLILPSWLGHRDE